MKTVVTILPHAGASANSFSLLDNILRLQEISSSSEANWMAALIPNEYKAIFGKQKKVDRNRLPIVCIKANGRTIHRVFKAVSANGFTGDYIGLSSESIRLLNDKDGNSPTRVEVSKGSKFMYYWTHPDAPSRFSVKLAIISVILAVLSIFLTICIR